MKIAATIFTLLLVLPAQIQAQQEAKPRTIRVLLTVGGHDFEKKPFYAMFDAMKDVTYTKAELPKDFNLLRPGLEKQFDVLVRYDMVDGFSPEQEKAFVKLLQTGIGLVSLHHNEAAHQKWPEYAKIIGRTPNKTWSEGEKMQVFVVDREHPVTRGVRDFQIEDETYGGYEVASNVHVLLKTNHPKNDPPELAWVTKYGNSRVVYLMLGHGKEAYSNPSYRTLLSNSIHWASSAAK